MRRYEDPVEVRRGHGDGPVEGVVEGAVATLDPAADDRAPTQFLWRGRLWKVRAVLAHWVETGPWWSSPGVRAVIGSEGAVAVDEPEPVPRPLGDLVTERELWRVEAGPGRAVAGPDGETGGVFDLAFDWADGRWQLVGCMD